LNTRVVSLKGNAELHNIAITGGNALNGGGIQVSGRNNVVNNTIIQGNTASRDGGGVHSLMYSELTLNHSIISQNKATYGGGYTGWRYSSASVEHNKFMYNEAESGGGVFIASYSNVFFNANIVDNNFATHYGGGIYVKAYTADKYIRNTLVTNNVADKRGGGVYRGALLGSVVYGNRAGIIKYSAIYRTTSQNSIIWGNAGTYLPRGIRDSIFEDAPSYCVYCSNMINQDPLFIDPENGDFRLQEGSPAIDAGGDTSDIYKQWQDDDFNGTKRGLDGDEKGISPGNDYDIGAFEYSPMM